MGRPPRHHGASGEEVNKLALFFLCLFIVGAWSGWFWGLAAIGVAVYLLRPWLDAEDRRGL